MKRNGLKTTKSDFPPQGNDFEAARFFVSYNYYYKKCKTLCFTSVQLIWKVVWLYGQGFFLCGVKHLAPAINHSLTKCNKCNRKITCLSHYLLLSLLILLSSHIPLVRRSYLRFDTEYFFITALMSFACVCINILL